MTNMDIVVEGISRNYDKNTIDLPKCDQIFDLNKDGIIDYKDLGIAGANTEEQNGIIVNEYNKCLALPPCGISKKIGDVDGDGNITQADVDLAGEWIISDIQLTSDQLIRVDVNGNGRFDANDIVLLNDYVNGVITSFPACTRATRFLYDSISLNAEPTGGEAPINYEWIITQPDLTEIIPYPTSLIYDLNLNQSGLYKFKLHASDSCNQHAYQPSSGTYEIEVLCTQLSCTLSIV